jgi:hypothetical protein
MSQSLEQFLQEQTDDFYTIKYLLAEAYILIDVASITCYRLGKKQEKEKYDDALAELDDLTDKHELNCRELFSASVTLEDEELVDDELFERANKLLRHDKMWNRDW